MSAARLVPWMVHELLEYGAGVFLILAPFFLLGDLDTAAFPLFVGVGVVLVVLQLITRGLASIAELLPVRAHATLDYLVAIFLIVAPWLFGFVDPEEPEAALFTSVFLGVALLVLSLVTAYPRPAGASAAGGATDATATRSGADDPSGRK